MKKILAKLSILLCVIGLLGALASCSARKKAVQKQRNEMYSTFNELRELLPEAAVTLEDKERIRLVFKTKAFFDLNSDKINSEFLPFLSKIAYVLNRYPKTSVLILGYTDSTGSDDLNRQLSWRRAESAKQALLTFNLENKRAFTWGFGSQNPAASNETLEGRQQNRRTEFVILFSDQPQNR